MTYECDAERGLAGLRERYAAGGVRGTASGQYGICSSLCAMARTATVRLGDVEKPGRAALSGAAAAVGQSESGKEAQGRMDRKLR